MPMSWTAQNDSILLLKLIETHGINFQADKVADAWPQGGERPTPRAVSERFHKLRKLANGDAATPKKSGARAPAPMPTKSTSTPKTTSAKKRKAAKSKVADSTSESDAEQHLTPPEDAPTPTPKSRKLTGGRKMGSSSAAKTAGRANVRRNIDAVDDDDDDNDRENGGSPRGGKFKQEAFNSDTSSVSPYMAASSARNNANNANSSFNSRGGFNFEMPTPGSSTFTFPTNNDRMTTKATFPLPALNFAPPTLPYTTGTSFGRASIGSGMGNVNPMNTSAADYLDLDNDTDNTAIDNANININANANTQRRRRPNPNIQNNGNGNGTGNGTANMPNPFLRPARSARAASKAASEGISSWLQFEKDEGKASGEKSSEEESQASEFQEGSDDEYV